MLAIKELVLDANFETISVRGQFDSADFALGNWAVVDYGRAGEALQRQYDPRLVLMDTRPTLRGGAPNWAVNEARCKLFGLAPNVTYDVKVTFMGDVAGPNALTGQITTLDETPPAPSLRFVYIDPLYGNDANSGTSPESRIQTLNRAFAISQPGDTIWLLPGMHLLTAIAYMATARGGTAENWVRITKWPGETGEVIVEGNGAVGPLLDLRGSYVCVDNITVRKSTQACILTNSYPAGAAWRWIHHCKITDWNINDANRNDYAGIGGMNNPERTIIHDVYLQRRDVVPGNQQGYGYVIHQKNQSTTGKGGGRHIVCHNVAIGGGDGISDEGETDPMGGWKINSDIYDNDISYIWDNAYQLDGAACNCAAWKNKMHHCSTGPSLDPIIVGPAYSIRDQISDILDLGGPWSPNRIGYKAGSQSDGMFYIIHQSCHVPPAVGPADAFAQQNSGLANFWFRNNAWQCDRYVIETGSKQGDGGIADTDYDSFYGTDPAKFIQWWYDKYLNLAAFTAATGNEVHGMQRDMVALDWIDPANGNFGLKSGSALIDSGEVILGINSDVENPSWNFQGAGPDRGAVESSETAQTYNLTITIEGDGRTDPAAGVWPYLQGTQVLVQAFPNPGSRFLRYDTPAGPVTADAVLVTMDEERFLNAVFEPIETPPQTFPVTITVVGNGTTNPSAPGPYLVEEGKLFGVKATAAPGWQQERWEANGEVVAAGDLNVLVVAPVALVVVFSPVPTPPSPSRVSLGLIAATGLTLGLIAVARRQK